MSESQRLEIDKVEPPEVERSGADPTVCELEKRVASLERQLKGAIQELQDVLFTISHDFKGPMRSILASGMILMEDYAPSLDATAREELKRQGDAARRMNKMLEELLALSRLSRRTVEPVQMNLGVTLARVAARYRIPSDQVDLEGDLLAHADEALMDLFFGLLVDNSVKFARLDTPLRLLLCGIDGTFLFRDNGIGVTAAQAERVFHPFERVHGGVFPGQGMGLTQAKRIIAMHEGEISAEPNSDSGMTVRFNLGWDAK